MLVIEEAHPLLRAGAGAAGQLRPGALLAAVAAGAGPVGPAPPLEFALPGLAARPGTTAGQRMAALRAHPLSPELAANQWAAWTALLGEDDQAGFTTDLATAAVGLPPGRQLRQVAGQLAAGDWLPAVMSFLTGQLPPDPAPAADGKADARRAQAGGAGCRRISTTDTISSTEPNAIRA